jgi:hypothetical protein
MFTIEHEFDATVVTLIDEGEDGAPPGEDVTVSAFEECITLTQLDPRSGEPVQVTLTMGQVRDLLVALNLPEGSYRRGG